MMTVGYIGLFDYVPLMCSSGIYIFSSEWMLTLGTWVG